MTLKIRYVRSGGFAGLVRGSTVDVEALAPVASRLVTGLVKTALASGVKPKKTTKAHGVADLRVHDFVIETDDGPLHWSFDDLSLPKALAPLVAFMAKRSKPIPPPE